MQLTTFPPDLVGLRKFTSNICGKIPSSGPVAQRIRHLTTNQGIAGSSPARVKLFRHQNVGKSGKKFAPPGGLEPPTFRLTAERASQLRHGGLGDLAGKIRVCSNSQASTERKKDSHAGS